MAHGHLERIGLEDNVEIRCVAARGDTEGTANDLALIPATGGTTFNENPGSIALLIRLGEFEFYTAGDQTDDDWKSEPKVEESVLNSGAIRGGNYIDLIKVSHHGSDTSTSDALVESMDPEVAVISSTHHIARPAQEDRAQAVSGKPLLRADHGRRHRRKHGGLHKV